MIFNYFCSKQRAAYFCLKNNHDSTNLRMNVLSFWRKNRGITLKICLYHIFFVPLRAIMVITIAEINGTKL